MLILLIHCAATLVMVGVIWFVQVVHYPLFEAVGDENFADYEARHVGATGLVVGPPMLIEAGTSVWLVIDTPAGVPPMLAWVALAALALIWGATATLQVPAHARLSQGFDPTVHRRLVRSNWLRTWAWAARGALAVWFIVLALPGAEASL